MGLLPKLVLEVPQRAVPAREEPDPEETAKSGCTVGTLKKMYGVLTELEAVGFTLVDTLLPACDGWLFTLCIKTMKRKKKIRKDNLQGGVKEKNQGICYIKPYQ